MNDMNPNEDIAQRLDVLDKEIADIKRIVKRMKLYATISFWAQVLFIILPFVALMIFVPWALNSYLDSLGSDSSGSGVFMLQGIDLLQELLQK